MAINIELPKLTELKPRIVVIGVGGAGGNAINNMIASGLVGVEYIAANTDAQALLASSAERRIQLGANLTEGLGAGSKPEIGEAAAEEAIEEIRGQIAGSHMVFIAAGMGGGTGTGAAAVIARAARDSGVLTVGIVTKPFQFEGTRRQRTAEAGIAELRKYVDTLIVIPNQNLFRIATEKTTFAEAFVLADQVLYSGVACIVDLIVKDGLINLDFADVRTVMSDMGTAMMGTGEASGERRALKAAEEAISNPLLDEVTLKGAKGVLLSIIGGRDMTLYEVDEAASRVRQEVDPEANIIVGATFDDQLGEHIRVAIVASGMQGSLKAASAQQATSAANPPKPPQPPTFAEGTSTNRAASNDGAVRAQTDANPPGYPTAAAMPPSPAPGGKGPAPAAGHGNPAGWPPVVDAGLARPTGPGDGQPPKGWLPNSTPPVAAPRHPTQVAEAEPRELWRTPGNVVIEEGRMPRPQPQMERAQPPPLAQPAVAQPFMPAPPEDVRRPAAHRVPEIEEFPVVGQREYRAKSNAYEASAAPARHDAPQRPASPRSYVEPIEPVQAPHKPGLLQRMIGQGRRHEHDGPDDERSAAHSSGARLPGFFNRNK